jgi:hypothetical protein
MQQLNADPEPPSKHLPDLPSAIDDVVLWLLAKDPAQRPPDLRTSVRALEQAAQEAGIDIGAPVAGWDAQSSPLQTQPPRRSAPVVAPAAPTIAPAAKKSRVPVIAALVVIPVIAVAAFIVLNKHHGKSKPKPAPAAVAPPPPKVEPPKRPDPPPPPPPKPTSAIITVIGTPDGTEVLLGGNVIGAAPGPIQVPYGTTPVVLTLRADGYLTTSVTVTPDGAHELAAPLKKKPRRSGHKKSTKDDIIEAFPE